MTDSDRLNRLYKLLADNFEPPCQYELDGIDTFDFLNVSDENGACWCEQHCSSTNFDGNIQCWRHFIDLLMQCESEQAEYGREQDEEEN